MNTAIAARFALVVIAAAAATGCATIVAKSSQVVTLTSVPDTATVSIINAAGVAVHSGTTPMTVTLKKGRGYFKPERYTVRFTKPGFQTREITVAGAVNGWYFGNILFGGLIGMLAVDPATGAMFTLKPKAVEARLDAMKVARTGGEQTFTVVLLASIPEDQLDQLMEIGTN
jgi:hypothetical protein